MPLEFQSNDPPHVLGIPVDITPPCPRNSSQRNPPPSPSEFRELGQITHVKSWIHPCVLMLLNGLGQSRAVIYL